MELQVGVKILLKNIENDRFLLLQRSSKYPGIEGAWDIVGGRIVSGETLLANLRREVNEETGLTIIGEPRVMEAQDILKDGKRHIVRITYVGFTKGDPVVDDESMDYRWVTFDELKNMANLDEFFQELVMKGLVREDLFHE
ncbi:MAG: NUDIX hydrolase [bacterium]|nr:NUDIX hydrolase [bacterium]